MGPSARYAPSMDRVYQESAKWDIWMVVEGDAVVKVSRKAACWSTVEVVGEGLSQR